MEELKATNFGELHVALQPFMQDKRWVFRGHADASWSLRPKAGRAPYSSVPNQVVFETWKRRAIEYVTSSMIDDWDWLAIAQHHGLATRLLDWTFNPLNAVFFALREEIDFDAAVIAIKPKYIVRPDQEKAIEVKRVKLYRPRGVVPRIVRQGGAFTFHPRPTDEMDPADRDLAGFQRIIIPKDSRSGILAQLAFYGVNSATLFPDLDGLSAFVNWGVASGEYFRYP